MKGRRPMPILSCRNRTGPLGDVSLISRATSRRTGLAITAGHGQERFIDLEIVDEAVQVVEDSHHGHAGELVARMLLLVHDSDHVVAVLRKHVHALDEHLAAKACADHQHAVSTYAL